MNFPRIVIFTGHYGSGKTNLALNFALHLRDEGKKTAICDIDIVNPYFRTADSEKLLSRFGIQLITSKFTNSNVDLPSIPPQAGMIFSDKETYAVFDVGGDDRGALALGRYEPFITKENTAMLFVINKYRPMTADITGTLEIMREIENASRIKFTGIVNNSNLGKETETDTVLSSVKYAGEISELSGLPIVMTSVREDLAGKIKEVSDLFPIKIMEKEIWKI